MTPLEARNRKFHPLLIWLGLGAMGSGALAILYFFPPTHSVLYPRCLFHQLTGLSCPGCGALRATHQLLHGHLADAFRLNPLLLILWPVLAANGLAQVVRQVTGREGARFWRHPIWIWLLLAVILAFGIGRNLPFGPLAQFRA